MADNGFRVRGQHQSAQAARGIDERGGHGMESIKPDSSTRRLLCLPRLGDRMPGILPTEALPLALPVRVLDVTTIVFPRRLIARRIRRRGGERTRMLLRPRGTGLF